MAVLRLTFLNVICFRVKMKKKKHSKKLKKGIIETQALEFQLGIDCEFGRKQKLFWQNIYVKFLEYIETFPL